MDKIDFQILDELQQDGRISNAEISRRLGLVPSAVLERIRRLERNGCIRNYEVRLNPRELDIRLTVFIAIDTDEAMGEYNVAAGLIDFPEIQEIHSVAGENDYILKVRVADTDELSSLLSRIGRVPGVRRSSTTLILNTYKETAAIRLKPDGGE